MTQVALWKWTYQESEWTKMPFNLFIFEVQNILP